MGFRCQRSTKIKGLDVCALFSRTLGLDGRKSSALADFLGRRGFKGLQSSWISESKVRTNGDTKGMGLNERVLMVRTSSKELTICMQRVDAFKLVHAGARVICFLGVQILNILSLDIWKVHFLFFFLQLVQLALWVNDGAGNVAVLMKYVMINADVQTNTKQSISKLP